MIKVSMTEAADHFAHWITMINKGEELMVVDHERPVARITRCVTAIGNRPKVGTLTSGPVHYSADCFAPLTDEELKDWGI